MSANNSTKQTLMVALLLCLACSIIVASAAVVLKPMQKANKLLDRNKNILSAAGIFDSEKHTKADVNKLFEQFEARFLDVRKGSLLTEQEAQALNLDVNTYNQRSAAKDPSLSYKLDAQDDIAAIGSQAKYVLVYLLKENDQLKRMVLPVHGYGLWGTLYGFMAVESDANTIAGLAFYEHKETPGLGAKVDVPEWKAQWPGKKIYAGDEVKIQLSKGTAPQGDDYAVDGLSGATLTTNGVTNLLQFWMGKNGYQSFMQNIQSTAKPSAEAQQSTEAVEVAKEEIKVGGDA